MTGRMRYGRFQGKKIMTLERNENFYYMQRIMAKIPSPEFLREIRGENMVDLAAAMKEKVSLPLQITGFKMDTGELDHFLDFGY
eukprot:CAMPEP_0170500638 /NCGR_PEP_ID=MMETSP0208-20121228/35534_1 /TAXON_ID=197538 /ORGANISM="Strombidium inclinatum, Strain S3" /LENGTH=83 /DNA_ID=CAMNT_0010778767 /DNA_START=159 /DNA_END=410 /DNA_ORIENTATION=+